MLPAGGYRRGGAVEVIERRVILRYLNA